MNLHPEPINIAFFALYWVVFVYSIVLHEIAHGYSSYLLGDPTAWKAGRLTLNPIKHIDPMLSIVMPIVLGVASRGNFIFGAAKPVPVNPLHYKDPRWGSLLSAAAGPLTNLVLALVFALLFKLSIFLAPAGATPVNAPFFACCMVLNVILAAFNLLPIPPLDGSHVISALLPRSLRAAYETLRPFGWIILILALTLPGSRDVIGSAVGWMVYYILVGLRIDLGLLPSTNPVDLLKGGG